jgi:hypothetical protein
MAEDYTYPPVRLPGNELAYTVHVIERTQLQPGDLLVLTTPQFLTNKAVEMITARMRGLLPSGVQVVLLDGGLTIDGIVSAQDGRE